MRPLRVGAVVLKSAIGVSLNDVGPLYDGGSLLYDSVPLYDGGSRDDGCVSLTGSLFMTGGLIRYDGVPLYDRRLLLDDGCLSMATMKIFKRTKDCIVNQN